MTIKERILRHLKSGHTLNPLEAMREYGTMSLPYHIHALRKEGYPIETRERRMFDGRRYAEYFMPTIAEV